MDTTPTLAQMAYSLRASGTTRPCSGQRFVRLDRRRFGELDQGTFRLSAATAPPSTAPAHTDEEDAVANAAFIPDALIAGLPLRNVMKTA